MIGRIKGLLAAGRLDHRGRRLGVGCEIEVTAAVRATLPAIGEGVLVFTHLVVREDAHALFGFQPANGIFPLADQVAGIGPSSLTLLSGMDVQEFGAASGGEPCPLVTLPGSAEDGRAAGDGARDGSTVWWSCRRRHGPRRRASVEKQKGADFAGVSSDRGDACGRWRVRTGQITEDLVRAALKRIAAES
jgi:hypothetical protein